jgi:hypothetical protein
MNKLASKLDWTRMLGFEQVADARSALAETNGKVGAKVGGKIGDKAGVKLGLKVGVKLGLKVGLKD